MLCKIHADRCCTLSNTLCIKSIIGHIKSLLKDGFVNKCDHHCVRHSHLLQLSGTAIIINAQLHTLGLILIVLHNISCLYTSIDYFTYSG